MHKTLPCREQAVQELRGGKAQLKSLKATGVIEGGRQGCVQKEGKLAAADS